MPQSPQDPAPAHPAGDPAPRASVLLAEGNPVQQCLVSELLQRADCQVRLAGEGGLALALAQSQPPALVLWDTCLPALAPAQALLQLRATPGLAGVALVAMSAGPAAHERRAWLQAGWDDHLAQPVDPAQLRALLLQWLPRTAALADTAANGPPGLDAEAGLRFLGGNAALYRQSLLTFASMYGAGLQAGASEPVALRREVHALGGAAAVLGATGVLALARALQQCMDRGGGERELTSARTQLQLKLQDLARDIRRWAQNTG